MKWRWALVVVGMVGCGAKGPAQSRAPSADVLVSDVDGGTVVGTAAPDPRRLLERNDERRALTWRECGAFIMHVVEIYAHDANVDPSTIEASRTDRATCDLPIFSDEIFDCVIAAKTQSELPPCMKYGDLPFSP